MYIFTVYTLAKDIGKLFITHHILELHGFKNRYDRSFGQSINTTTREPIICKLNVINIEMLTSSYKTRDAWQYNKMNNHKYINITVTSVGFNLVFSQGHLTSK